MTDFFAPTKDRMNLLKTLANLSEYLGQQAQQRGVEFITDLPAELRLLDFIRAQAPDLAPGLPADLAVLLWREYLIPWTKQSEVAHLLDP